MMDHDPEITEDDDPIHVLDLPQLYQKPSAAALNQALALLASTHAGFCRDLDDAPKVHPEGVTRYLTNIIASPLAWLPDDSLREAIWERASSCLAQRSGRTAMGDMTRSFAIPVTGDRTFDISLREPGLTGDDLGHKTWASSFVLAKALHGGLRVSLPQAAFHNESSSPAVLELGAGTGLVGLAAAAAWRTRVLLTDLPEIHANLQHNVKSNADIIREQGGEALSGTLDWRQPERLFHGEQLHPTKVKFSVVIAADPIYSSDHPRLLVDAAAFWLAERDGLLLLAYPLREAYHTQFEELERLLRVKGFSCSKELEVEAMDDWKDVVKHMVSVWCWK